MTRTPHTIAFALALALQTAGGQRGPAGTPPGRAHHSVFYDQARQRVVLTGGSAVDDRRNVTEFDDLWSFDGSAWTSLLPPGDATSGIRISADRQQRIYSLGGFATDSGSGGLRLLDDGRWRRVSVIPSRAMRGELGFVYDAARDRFVAFGSRAAQGQATAEVWELDGSRWTKSVAPPPPGRFAGAMVYDARRQRTVLFGGMGARSGDASAPLLGDTWEFDGKVWVEAPVAGPPARLSAGITYDTKRGLVLLFGGGNHERAFNDLWSWDGTAWRKLAENGPEPRIMGYIAYDTKRDRTVLFGGRRASPDNTNLADTWEWDGNTWRRIGNPQSAR